MEKVFTHCVYLVTNDEYYISEYDVLGTWDDTDENWEAFYKRTYPELSNRAGKVLKFQNAELLDFINDLKISSKVKQSEGYKFIDFWFGKFGDGIIG